MSLARCFAASLLASAACVACSPPPPVTADSGTDALAADASPDTAAADAAAPSDAVDDTASPADASDDATGDDAPDLDAPAADYGQCGRVVHDCRCACGADTACRQGCNSDAVACGDCVNRASARCCPTEFTAVVRCYLAATGMSDAGTTGGDAGGGDDAGPPCTDAACARMRCAAQYTALNTCLQHAVMTSAQCRDGFIGCYGTATCM